MYEQCILAFVLMCDSSYIPVTKHQKCSVYTIRSGNGQMVWKGPDGFCARSSTGCTTVPWDFLFLIHPTNPRRGPRNNHTFLFLSVWPVAGAMRVVCVTVPERDVPSH